MEAILQKIKADGFRLTKIRRAMVAIFCEEKCLLSPAQILTKLAARNLEADRTTVYRELCFLLEQNIIKKAHIANHKIYYEILLEGRHHHHLICTKCSCVKEIELGKHLLQQEKKIYQQEKFKVVSHSLEFFGVCNNCL